MHDSGSRLCACSRLRCCVMQHVSPKQGQRAMAWPPLMIHPSDSIAPNHVEPFNNLHRHNIPFATVLAQSGGEQQSLVGRNTRASECWEGKRGRGYRNGECATGGKQDQMQGVTSGEGLPRCRLPTQRSLPRRQRIGCRRWWWEEGWRLWAQAQRSLTKAACVCVYAVAPTAAPSSSKPSSSSSSSA